MACQVDCQRFCFPAGSTAVLSMAHATVVARETHLPIQSHRIRRKAARGSCSTMSSRECDSIVRFSVFNHNSSSNSGGSSIGESSRSRRKTDIDTSSNSCNSETSTLTCQGKSVDLKVASTPATLTACRIGGVPATQEEPCQGDQRNVHVVQAYHVEAACMDSSAPEVEVKSGGQAYEGRRCETQNLSL